MLGPDGGCVIQTIGLLMALSISQINKVYYIPAFALALIAILITSPYCLVLNLFVLFMGSLQKNQLNSNFSKILSASHSIKKACKCLK